ncbi:MAG: ABC transporter ATP-binding protein [Proteobacteria bacterium]|nr:ABC transporter ATP-binding protein [Pseudomonadota bacterium]
MNKEKQSAIHIENLTKHYRSRKSAERKEALKGISLDIPKGCIFGLLGPNGAGKSTLINILAGLTVKTSGTVCINGIEQDKDPRATRFELGVVPQEVVLDPFFNIRETLEYHAGYYGIPKAKRRTDEILEALHLTDKAGVNSRRLSGGMKRRVLIAKALVHNPPILILDEPTAGVDVELRTQLWDYVQELNRRGTTILLTTHYLEEAERLCDYIAIINHGQIIANDKTSALKQTLDQKQLTIKFTEPQKKVPAFLKTMDFVQGDSQTFTIRYKRSKTSVDALLQKIHGSKLKISDISTHEPDLEDIFRHLVQKRHA